MPTPKTGFGYAVFGTDAFGDEPDTAGFETKIAADFNEPIIRFVYDGRIYDDFVIDAPIISRGGDAVAGTVSIVLSNTPRAQIHATTLAFVDNSPNPDTITDSGNGLSTQGFEVNDRITVSGSTSNDSTYHIASVAAGALTLAAGDSLTNEAAGDLVTISSQPAFNFFVEDRINTIGKTAKLWIYFQGTDGALPLLTGTVEEVSYNEATVTLSIRDRMAPMLEKKIGSGQAPADYYTMQNPFNPATIVWNVLITWGELDSTFTTANTQINFTSWQAWYNRCAAHNYKVRGRFTGMTIQNMLLRIGDMTNSFIWVDGEGFFRFNMFEPPHLAGASDATYDVDNSIAIDIDIDKSTIENTMNIYYGHNPDVGDNSQAKIASRRIGFENPDRIFLHSLVEGAGFETMGFDTNDPITISGSEFNDGKYFLLTATNTVLTLTPANGVVDEDSGASVTLAQLQDTTTMQTTSLVFNDTGSKDTITDVTEQFVLLGFKAGDFVTISGSTSNDGMYSTDSITAGTITLTLLSSTLTQEASGSLVVLTQTHSVSITATTIAFNDDERTPGVQIQFGEGDQSEFDHINKSDGGLLDAGFVSQYAVTVTGASEADNNDTFRISNVTQVQMDLLQQVLKDENVSSPGDEGKFVTITQAHSNASSGKQFEGLVIDIDSESINLPGVGVRTFTDEDKIIWHDNLLSAASVAEEYLKIYKFPGEITRINATMEGFLSEIGDEIHVTEGHKNISDQTYFITGIDIDIDNASAEITAERGN